MMHRLLFFSMPISTLSSVTVRPPALHGSCCAGSLARQSCAASVSKGGADHLGFFLFLSFIFFVVSSLLASNDGLVVVVVLILLMRTADGNVSLCATYLLVSVLLFIYLCFVSFASMKKKKTLVLVLGF